MKLPSLHISSYDKKQASMKEIDSEEFEVTLKEKKYSISSETISKAFNIPNCGTRLSKKKSLFEENQ